MKIKNKISPYPILFKYNDDFINSSFSSNINAINKPNTLDLKIDFTLNDDTILNLIQDDKAVYLVHAECPITSYRKLSISKEPFIDLKVPSTMLRGKFEVCTFIVANGEIKSYSNPNFHEDYTGLKFNLDKGNIIAIGTAKESDISKTDEDLENLPSIIKVFKSKDKKFGEMTVDTEGDYILVGLYEDCFEKYSILGRSQFKNTMLSLILLPAMIVVLERVAEDYDNMEELKWFKVISSLLESIGVNVYELNNDLSSKGSILSIAQSIFDSPISRSITEIYCIDEEAVADEA